MKATGVVYKGCGRFIKERARGLGMVHEYVLDKYACRFDEEEARFRLDSIAFYAERAGLSQVQVCDQLEAICGIASLFNGDALESLKMIERRYAAVLSRGWKPRETGPKDVWVRIFARLEADKQHVSLEQLGALMRYRLSK